jgi:subtilisin family serine protease
VTHGIAVVLAVASRYIWRRVHRFAQSAAWLLALFVLLAGSQIAQSATVADGQVVTSHLDGLTDAQPGVSDAVPLDAPTREHAPESAPTARLAGLTQLPTRILAADDPSLPPHLRGAGAPRALPRDLPGRRIPGTALISDLGPPDLACRAVPLPEANTLAHVNCHVRRFGRLQTAAGEIRLFNPECVLVKFKGQSHVSALGAEPGRELETARALADRPDVELAELDVLQCQAFSPNDPLLAQQWHHQVLGSFGAWDKSLGQGFVRIAIVDAPFQMDHPDLAANTLSGWDMVANQPVTASSGSHHSTFGAGLAAGVIGNGLGIAGAGNCRILPLNINGFTSEMCNAVYWAATNGVRVVNISWTGADSDALNAAGAYLRTNARGILAMAGLNGPGFVHYPNQPDIWCIAMTDAADNQRSAYGDHIDFAAPGWAVYSTTTNGGYAFDSGTSYATPLFCGVVAVLFSINPTLGSEEVIDLLKSTAIDKGPTGWDQWYGWGRIDFGAAAAAAAATLPVVSGALETNSQFCVATGFKSGLTYTLWRTSTLSVPQWVQVTNTVLSTNNGRILLTDPSPTQRAQFYRVGIFSP